MAKRVTKRMKERAFQFWGVLAYAASKSQIMTYVDLSNATGYSQQAGDILALIQQHCWDKGLPPLTALVVSVKTGKPLNWDDAEMGDWAAEVQRVFKRRWLRKGSELFVKSVLPGTD